MLKVDDAAAKLDDTARATPLPLSIHVAYTLHRVGHPYALLGLTQRYAVTRGCDRYRPATTMFIIRMDSTTFILAC